MLSELLQELSMVCYHLMYPHILYVSTCTFLITVLHACMHRHVARNQAGWLLIMNHVWFIIYAVIIYAVCYTPNVAYISCSLLTHDTSHMRTASMLATELTSVCIVGIPSHKVPCPCPPCFTSAERHYQWGCFCSPKILSIVVSPMHQSNCNAGGVSWSTQL